MAASNRETRKAKVMEALNKARAMELYAITQYMNQHYALDDMDYGELAANMKLIAIDEMRHAEMFAERLNSLCQIEVREAQNGDRVHPGLALIAPGGKLAAEWRGVKVPGHAQAVFDALKAAQGQ